MGFVDFHGTKEDRYTEVLEYSRAQQEEDARRKARQKIILWLSDLTGNADLAMLNAEELLKNVIVRYRVMQGLWHALTSQTGAGEDNELDQLWAEFSLDLAGRHLRAFHLEKEREKKHLEVFQTKIFKLTDQISVDEYYKKVCDDPKYRHHLLEWFDPTWKGQRLFRWLRALAGDDEENIKRLEEICTADIKLCLLLGLYLHQVIMPCDDGWMLESEAEYRALSELCEMIRSGTLIEYDANASETDTLNMR